MLIRSPHTWYGVTAHQNTRLWVSLGGFRVSVCLAHYLVILLLAFRLVEAIGELKAFQVRPGSAKGIEM